MATLTPKDYKAEATKLTVTDTTTNGTVTANSSPFTVAPAGLDHFSFDTISGPETAASFFGVTVRARDAYGNLQDDYNGSGTLSGLANSPAPVNKPADYDPLSFSSGVASGNVTAYFANDPSSPTDNTQLTVTGSSKTGQSNTFKVNPDALDHFTFATITGPKTAGTAFGANVTARDQWANQQYLYNGSGNLSGLANSPAPVNKPADYDPLSFSSGVASGNVTAYFANDPSSPTDNTQLTVTGSSKTGQSNTFKVDPDALDHFTFATITSPKTAGTAFGANVTARDQWANQQYLYNGSGTLSGLANSPAPVNKPADYDPLSFSSGVASSNVTAYFANDPSSPTDNTQLTVTGSSKTGQSNTFKVNPDALDHFTFATITGPKTAGTAFGANVTARDQWANQQYLYNGSGTLSGLANSPAPVNKPADYDPLSFSSGVASGNVTAYFANDPSSPTDNTQLTVTGSSKTGQSNTFKVAAGPLGSFTLATIGTQVAGNQFPVSATAYDIYSNVKKNYGGGATLSTDAGNSGRGCGAGNNSPCSPSLGSFGTWTSGVASANVTLYSRQTARHLTATDSGKMGTSNAFDVNPNEPAAETFTTQPSLTQINTAIAPAVVVRVDDFYGNPVLAGKQVTMFIGQNSGGGTLTGGGPVATLSNGTATFSVLKINNQGVNYTLLAKVPTTDLLHVTSPVTQASSQFDIGSQVNNCTPTTCTATGTATDGLTTLTVTVTNVTSPPAFRLSPAAASGKVGAVVAASIKAPIGTTGAPICGVKNGSFGAKTGAAGTAADLVSVAGTFTLEERIDKSLVKKSGLNSPNDYDICLGAINLTPNPAPGCATPQSVSFPAKGGGCAVQATAPDGSIQYWALMPDAANGVKSCTDSRVKFPVMIKRQKNGAGDVLLTACVPAPYDPHPINGP